MNKEKFLEELRAELANYEVDDIDEVIAYFDEMIEDRKDNGMDEATIIEHLDSPKEIALVLKGKEYKEDKVDEQLYDDEDHIVYRTKGTDIIYIKVNVMANDVEVIKGEDDDIYFIYDQKEEGRFNITNKGDELKIIYNGPDFGIFEKHEFGDLKLILPKGYLGEMKIETVSGDIDIKDTENSYLKLESVSGDITIRDCEINILKAQATSGHIEIEDTKGQEIKVEAVSGRIELKDIAYDFIKATNVSGAINVDALGDEDDYAIYFDRLFESYKLRSELKDSCRLKLEAVTGHIDYHFHN